MAEDILGQKPRLRDRFLAPVKRINSRISRSIRQSPSPEPKRPSAAILADSVLQSSSSVSLVAVLDDSSSQTLFSQPASANTVSNPAQSSADPSPVHHVYESLLPNSLISQNRSDPPTKAEQLKGLGTISWQLLKQTLKVVDTFSAGCPPLKAAVTALLAIMGYVDVGI